MDLVNGFVFNVNSVVNGGITLCGDANLGADFNDSGCIFGNGRISGTLANDGRQGRING